jgi:flagellar hook-basal body complex protein FliE
MDALSALRMMMTPEMVSKVANPVQEPGQGKTIPLEDLQKLNPSITIPSSEQVQGTGSFQNVLGDFLKEVSDKQVVANDTVNGLMSGKNVSLHQAMISMEEASVSFQLMLEVRNKLLDSYQELMRMQI